MEYKLKIKITKVETNTVHYIVAPNEPVDAAKCFKNILKMKALTQPKSNNNYKFQEDSDDESGNNHWVQVVIYSLDEFLSAREKQSRDMNNYPFCQELLIYDDKDSV